MATATFQRGLPTSRFRLGRLVMTRGINDWIAEGSARVAKGVLEAFRRHARGDWGDVHADDVTAHDGDGGDTIPVDVDRREAGRRAAHSPFSA